MNRWTMLLVMAAMAGAIGATAMRPKCATVTATSVATAQRATFANVPMPAAIASFPTPATWAPRRNVFAYRSTEERRPRVAATTPPPPQPPQVIQQQETVIVPPPKPAYDYVGSFGPQELPILVYKGNGEVVNVAIKKP